MDIKKLLKTWLLLALGVIIAAHTARGISYDSYAALVVAVFLLSLCNMVLKPLLMLFSLPFIILTFGIGIWLINALLFLLVGTLVDGFYVFSFWNALWGALVVSLTGAIANIFLGGSRVQIRTNVRTSRGGQSTGQNTPPRRKQLKDDKDVIDI